MLVYAMDGFRGSRDVGRVRRAPTLGGRRNYDRNRTAKSLHGPTGAHHDTGNT